jgi:deoxyuridine 5'-triphosphate nucleotidohydrolase
MYKITEYLNNLNELNQNLFNTSNINEFSYLLGFLSNIGYISIKYNKLKINISIQNKYILDLLQRLLNKNLLTFTLDNNYYKIFISSEEIIKDFLLLLNIKKGKQFHLVDISNLYNINSNNNWKFLNGYIDYNSSLLLINNSPELVINFTSIKLLKYFNNLIKIPHIKINNKLIFSSTNCIDLLGELYKYNHYYNLDIYNKFQNLINWKFIHSISSNNIKLDKCKFYKVDKDAIFPSKHYESDVGYDLTIIKKIKNLTSSTILYDTGIKVSVDYGYYIEIVPRSSLSKSGYILANSIGIIEKTYSGNLLVALTKIDKDMPDITLPFRCCQLLFKPQISLNIINIDSNKFNNSNNTINNSMRGDGGFGSSNK